MWTYSMFLVVPNSATCLVCAIYNKYNYAEHQHFAELWTNSLCCASVCFKRIPLRHNCEYKQTTLPEGFPTASKGMYNRLLCFIYIDYLGFTLKLFNPPKPASKTCSILWPLDGGRSFQTANAGSKGSVGGVRHQIFGPTLLKKASGVWVFLKQDSVFTAWASYLHTITDKQTRSRQSSLIQVSDFRLF